MTGASKMESPFGNAGLTSEVDLLYYVRGRSGTSINLGRFVSEEGVTGGEINYREDRHILVFGPTGSGKTKRFLIPNLLLGLENESVIVIDPKGEVADVTAKHRRALGHNVVMLNPFNVRGLGSAGFNPMAALDPKSDTFYDDAAALGEALIKVEGSEPHWSESAQGLMVALLMWEKRERGDKASLENVRQMLTEPVQYERQGREKRRIAGLAVTAAIMADEGGYEIASLA